MQALHPNTVVFRASTRRMAGTAIMTIGFVLATAVAAQIRIPVPGTPIAITGQTFAVLLAGATIGPRLGATAMALYGTLGALGLPFFAGGEGGWTYATGAPFGYLIGFVAAAWLVGRLAERRSARSAATLIPVFLAGTAVIYAFGVAWLWFAVDAIPTFSSALAAGVAPFVVGDAVKALIAGASLPAARRLVARTPDP